MMHKKSQLKGVAELASVRKFEGCITIAELRQHFLIPPDAEVYVRIPGGGDWSNTNLNLEDGTPIYVRWEVRD